MAFIFFYIQIAFPVIKGVTDNADKPASKFWKERKSAVERLKNQDEESQTLEKSLPAKIAPPKEQDSIFSQLPALNLNILNNALPSNKWQSSPKFDEFAPSGHDYITVPAGTLKKKLTPQVLAKVLPDWFKSVPLSYADMVDFYVPDNWKANDVMIIHIQDAHENYEAQRNIAKIIETISGGERKQLINPSNPNNTHTPTKYNVVVGLEGASGDLSLSSYRSFPDKGIVKEIADHFLKESLISGAEYAGLTLDLERSRGEEPPVQFIGVEDPKLYLEHIQAFKGSISLEKEAKTHVSKLEDKIANLKERTFNPDLRELDLKISQYHQEKIALSDYLKYLTERGIPPSFEMTHHYINALALEETLNYDQIESERRSLTNSLTEKISKAELNNLLTASFSYRLGNISYGTFYRYLKDICGAYKINLTQWSEMDKYIRYVLIADQIRSEDLFFEISYLEKRRIESLIESKEERELVQLSQDLTLIEKLTTFSLSPEEWKRYQERKEDIRKMDYRLNKMLAGENGGNRSSGINQGQETLNKEHLDFPTKDSSDFSQLLMPFEGFNKAAIKRNNSLVNNLLKKTGLRESFFVSGRTGDSLNSSNALGSSNSRIPQAAILIAGGFHTSGITELLKSKKIAYIVLSPRIGKVEGAGLEYLNVFRRDKTPLEKLFTGERITLKSPLPTALNPSTEELTLATYVVERQFSLFAAALLTKKILSQVTNLSKEQKKEIRNTIFKWIKDKGNQFQTIESITIEKIEEYRNRDGALEKVEITVILHGKDGQNDSIVAVELLTKGSQIKRGIEDAEVLGGQEASVSVGENILTIYVPHATVLREVRDVLTHKLPDLSNWVLGRLKDKSDSWFKNVGERWFILFDGDIGDILETSLGKEKASVRAIKPMEMVLATVVTAGLSLAFSVLFTALTGQQLPTAWQTLIAAPVLFMGAASLFILLAIGIGRLLSALPSWMDFGFDLAYISTSITNSWKTQFIEVEGNTIKINPYVFRFFSLFPEWVQNMILDGFGIMGHETAHLRGHGEFYAYGTMQILPAFFGSFMLGSIAIRLGASPFVITLSGMLGAALAVGLLNFYYVMEFMYLGEAKRAAGPIENKMILDIVFYMSGIRPREKADHLIAEVESHLAEAPNREELEESLESMMKTLKDLHSTDQDVGEALYYLLMISNKERVPGIVKELQNLIKNLDIFFTSRGDIWNIIQHLLRENREDVEEVIPLFGVIANNLKQENIANYFIWRILKDISATPVAQLQELASQKTAEAYRKFIQKVPKGEEKSGMPSGYDYSSSVLVAISRLPEPAKRALELVNEDEKYERLNRFLKRFLTGESDLAEVYFKLPENVEDYFSLEALATMIYLDEYQFRDQTDFDLYRAKDYFSYYAQDPEMVKIRYLLYSHQYEKLKELIVKERIPEEKIIKAILFNHENEIMTQTSDLILQHEGTRGILKGMTPLSKKVSSRFFTIESVLPLFSYLGSSMDEKRFSELLPQLGYQLYFHEGNRLIIPRVYDNLASAFRGSAEYDHVEANYLTHALTTAILHYARKKGEAKYRGQAYGANAFHEFDLSFMMLEGRNNREADPAVSLAFHYNAQPLPEYARKRTVTLMDLPTSGIIQRLLEWQMNERTAKQNILKILKWIESGELNRTELTRALELLEIELDVLHDIRKCGLKEEYWKALFGTLDEKFFRELEKNYHHGKSNRRLLRRLLLNGTRKVTVAVTYARDEKPEIRLNHPFNEIKIVFLQHLPFISLRAKKSLIDYLELESSLRVGTHDDQDVSTISRNSLSKEVEASVPITIPEGVFNVLSLPEVQTVVESLTVLVRNKESELGKKLERIKGATFDGFTKFLKDIGKWARVRGPVVYYPFGGFDPYTPFSAVEDATDIFSIGIDGFGSPENLLEFLKSTYHIEASFKFAFDTLEDLSILLSHLPTREKLVESPVPQMMIDHLTREVIWTNTMWTKSYETGLGPMAMTRIISFLGGRITGLYYFDINENGDFLFLDREAASYGKSAVIEFEDENGIKKRYWYIQHNINANDEGFTRFIEKFKFQTLFIKSALSMWDERGIDRVKAIQKTLTPAKRNSARVITDKRIRPGGDADHQLGQHPIWKPGYSPDSILLEGGQQFGYSIGGKDGNRVYAGDAKGLINPDTPIDQIEGYIKMEKGEEDAPFASIFYPIHRQGKIADPKNFKEHLHNILYELGDPIKASPSWETAAFMLVGTFVIPVLLTFMFGIDPNIASDLGNLWSISFFAFSHTIVEWWVRAKEHGFEQAFKPDNLIRDAIKFYINNLLSLSITHLYLYLDLVTATILTIALHTLYNLLIKQAKNSVAKAKLEGKKINLLVFAISLLSPASIFNPLRIMKGSLQGVQGSLKKTQVSSDPFGKQEDGEEEIKRLLQSGEIPLNQIYTSVGDGDSFGDTNKVGSKHLIGTLGKPDSTRVLFSNRPHLSIYKELRIVMQEKARKYEGVVYRYVGGDEFMPFFTGTQEEVEQKLKSLVEDVNEYFKERYGIYRIKGELTKQQVRRLRNMNGSLVLARHGKGYNILFERNGRDRQKIKAELETLFKEAEDIEVMDIDIETEVRGLLTVSIGAVSAQQVLDYIVSQSAKQETERERGKMEALGATDDEIAAMEERVKQPYRVEWVEIKNGREVIKQEKLEEFYIWSMRIANDMLKKAKDEFKDKVNGKEVLMKGRNRAELPKSPQKIAEYLKEIHKEITPSKIEELREKLKQQKEQEGKKEDGKDGLTGAELYEVFRGEVSKSDHGNLMLIAMLNWGLGQKRAFHELQDRVGYLSGNEAIKLLFEQIQTTLKEIEKLQGLKQGEKLSLARGPPDKAYYYSTNVNMRGPPELFLKLNHLIRELEEKLNEHLKKELNELKEREDFKEKFPDFDKLRIQLVIYDVSLDELKKLKERRPELAKRMQNGFQAIDLMSGLIDSASVIGMNRIKEVLDVREIKVEGHKDLLVLGLPYKDGTLDLGKIEKLLELYEEAEERIAEEAYYNLLISRGIDPKSRVNPFKGGRTIQIEPKPRKKETSKGLVGRIIASVVKDEEGSSMVEYGAILAAINPIGLFVGGVSLVTWGVINLVRLVIGTISLPESALINDLLEQLPKEVKSSLEKELSKGLLPKPEKILNKLKSETISKQDSLEQILHTIHLVQMGRIFFGRISGSDIPSKLISSSIRGAKDEQLEPQQIARLSKYMNSKELAQIELSELVSAYENLYLQFKESEQGTKEREMVKEHFGYLSAVLFESGGSNDFGMGFDERWKVYQGLRRMFEPETISFSETINESAQAMWENGKRRKEQGNYQSRLIRTLDVEDRIPSQAGELGVELFNIDDLSSQGLKFLVDRVNMLPEGKKLYLYTSKDQLDPVRVSKLKEELILQGISLERLIQIQFGEKEQAIYGTTEFGEIVRRIRILTKVENPNVAIFTERNVFKGTIKGLRIQIFVILSETHLIEISQDLELLSRTKELLALQQ